VCTNILKYLLLLLVFFFVSIGLTINFNSSYNALASTKKSIVIEALENSVTDSQPPIKNYRFVPSVVSVNLGDTVNWINTDKINHTVTSIFFSSEILNPQISKISPSSFNYTFIRPGIYIYLDRLHPSTVGIVYANATETQRELVPTSTNARPNIRVEMPQNAAYRNNLGSFFIPSLLNSQEGNKIIWTNKDYIPHTATAADGSFDTGPILNGQSVSKILNVPGTHSYYCEIHPWMIGMIHITEAD
jgi:plastocyanin